MTYSAGSVSVQQMLLLGLVLLAATPIRVQAKHTLKLHSLEKLHEDNDDLESVLRIAEDEENLVKVSGELKQHVTIDNEWQIHFLISRAKERDEEFEEFLNMPRLGVCDVMKTYYKEFLYEKLKEHSNAPHPDSCPLPPENYHLKDYPLDVHQLKKILVPGYYRIESKLLKEDHIKLSYLAVIQVE
ncbi:uncharacterized protein LOC108154351 [Drosophila miranda]|uniref:uncharacterized protein LOC108154351 n=1 Tax=Drosophila miranda TaxID=7229 RepID=UPI00143FAEC6|nr:uncharacterized protein LOC108154351 [Drosophila miranda]